MMFHNLNKKQQRSMLEELSKSNLSDREVEVLNYLRKNNTSFNEVIDYFAQKRINEFLEERNSDLALNTCNSNTPVFKKEED